MHTCPMQMAAFALGQVLPEEQRPFPMDMIHINDTRSDIVPNAGQSTLVMQSSLVLCIKQSSQA